MSVTQATPQEWPRQQMPWRTSDEHWAPSAYIERAVADAVQFHSAKRTGMAILQEYVGPWELNEGQRNALLHHRATGKERSAGAYNPRLLVAPVKKASHLGRMDRG